MLARRYRINTKEDFDESLDKGFKVVCHHFVLYGLNLQRETSRLGVIVSRKVGGAVVRNRVKRAVRQAFFSDVMPSLQQNLDIVAIARASASKVKTSKELQTSFSSCCRRLLKTVK